MTESQAEMIMAGHPAYEVDNRINIEIQYCELCKTFYFNGIEVAETEYPELEYNVILNYKSCKYCINE